MISLCTVTDLKYWLHMQFCSDKTGSVCMQ